MNQLCFSVVTVVVLIFVVGLETGEIDEGKKSNVTIQEVREETNGKVTRSIDRVSSNGSTTLSTTPRSADITETKRKFGSHIRPLNGGKRIIARGVRDDDRQAFAVSGATNFGTHQIPAYGKVSEENQEMRDVIYNDNTVRHYTSYSTDTIRTDYKPVWNEGNFTVSPIKYDEKLGDRYYHHDRYYRRPGEGRPNYRALAGDFPQRQSPYLRRDNDHIIIIQPCERSMPELASCKEYLDFLLYALNKFQCKTPVPTVQTQIATVTSAFERKNTTKMPAVEMENAERQPSLRAESARRTFGRGGHNYYYDYYDYNDYDYWWYKNGQYKNYPAKTPMVISPDMDVLQPLSYIDAPSGGPRSDIGKNTEMVAESQTKNVIEVDPQRPNFTIGPATSPPNNKEFSLLPVAEPYTVPGEKSKAEATESHIHPAPAVQDFANQTVSPREEARRFYVGVSIPNFGGTTTETGVHESQDGCHDKMFPCPDNINVTYPVIGFCNYFIACESGKPHPEFCQGGLHFNLVTKKCDLPHNSICTYSCPAKNGYFGIPGDCGGFFRCRDWYPEYRTCPPRMHWDFKAKICTFEELSSCPLKCDAPFQVKPYNGVCNSYVICTRSVPTYHRCPIGSHFDRNTLRCIPKSQSDCVNELDYITRYRGIGNGEKQLCADVKTTEGVSRWCQELNDMDG